MVTPEAKLAQMGLTLPTPKEVSPNRVRSVRVGDLVFLSGAGPKAPDGSEVKGKLGRDLTVEQGYHAARLCAINLLGNLKGAIGELKNVKRVVKVLGMVNSAPEFTEQPKVVDGCSDLLFEVLGDRGRHARSAVGMAALPANIAVEIEMIVQVE